MTNYFGKLFKINELYGLIPLFSILLLNSCIKHEDEWISLFNGKNLDGWHVKIAGYPLDENYGNTFRVEDGLLKVRYDQYDSFDKKFAHIFYDQEFSDYILKVEYRFVGEQINGGPKWAYRNNGIMFHCQSPESIGLDQNFPVCIEAQLLGGNGSDERPTGNVATPGTHIVINDSLITKHQINSNSKTFHGDQWVTMEVEVHHDSLIRHIVNGEVVLEYTRPQLDNRDTIAAKIIEQKGIMLKKGYIALQGESHPTDFKSIEIKVLKNSPDQ